MLFACAIDGEDETAIDLFVEVKVEVVERRLRIARLRLFAPPLQQPVTSTSELIGDRAGDQIDRRHRFGLSMQ